MVSPVLSATGQHWVKDQVYERLYPVLSTVSPIQAAMKFLHGIVDSMNATTIIATIRPIQEHPKEHPKQNT